MPILKNTLNPFSAARTSLAIATAVLLTAGTLCVAGPAVAAQTCSSTISNSTVPGDVVVSGRCVISGNLVEGGVSVQPGATLVVVNSSVQGAVKGEQPKEIEIKGSNLDKGISIAGGIDVLETHQQHGGWRRRDRLGCQVGGDRAIQPSGWARAQG